LQASNAVKYARIARVNLARLFAMKNRVRDFNNSIFLFSNLYPGMMATLIFHDRDDDARRIHAFFIAIGHRLNSHAV